MNRSPDICSPYERTSERERYRRIVLLKRYKPHGDAPRDFRSYDGRGASKALLLAIDRAAASATCGSGRLYALHTMALEQVEREQAREQRDAA